MPMPALPPIQIDPPLINSANPWATNFADLQALYECPHTGAITTRTSLLDGFPHDPAVHQYTFFSPTTSTTRSSVSPLDGRSPALPNEPSSLNTLGYSPIPLREYLSYFIPTPSKRQATETARPIIATRLSKPIIISVTGSPGDIAECYGFISAIQAEAPLTIRLMMEINLSCPNIVHKPPPAYDAAQLREYLNAVAQARRAVKQRRGKDAVHVHVGIKTPPYTYQGQFETLVNALSEAQAEEEDRHGDAGCVISFVTAVNTLGSCLVGVEGGGDGDDFKLALNSAAGLGIGGMAGSALHPLALGNVKMIRTLLDATAGRKGDVKFIKIIGVGGVADHAGFQRMKAVGADVVGVGTALGREGVSIFERILGQGQD